MITARTYSGTLRPQSLLAKPSWRGAPTNRTTLVAHTLTLQPRPRRDKILARTAPVASNLSDEYYQLNQEIALLQCELKPLREKVVRLQRSIMSTHGAFIERDENDINASEAIKYTSAMIELDNERVSLKEQLANVREYLSNAEMNNLRKEIEEGSEICALFVASCQDLEAQTKDIKSQISTYRHSTMYFDVQDQRKKIMKLVESYNEEKQKHVAMTTEMDQLQPLDGETEERVQKEADMVIKLTRKLDRLRRVHYDRSEYYIALREQQMKEIEETNAEIARQGKAIQELDKTLEERRIAGKEIGKESSPPLSLASDNDEKAPEPPKTNAKTDEDSASFSDHSNLKKGEKEASQESKKSVASSQDKSKDETWDLDEDA